MKLVASIKKGLGVYHRILNYAKLSFYKVEYDEYPVIKGSLVLSGYGKLKIGRSVTINSSRQSNPVGLASNTLIYVSREAKVSIGNNVGISNTLLYAWKSIVIEDDVMIGGGCQIFDTDFHSIRYEERILYGDKAVKFAPVVIKKGAFIGASSIILKGVTVGEKSIVAAGSVVSRTIPAEEIWGGNPAKFIKKI